MCSSALSLVQADQVEDEERQLQLSGSRSMQCGVAGGRSPERENDDGAPIADLLAVDRSACQEYIVQLTAGGSSVLSASNVTDLDNTRGQS